MKKIVFLTMFLLTLKTYAQITGSGTANYLPKFSTATNINNSSFYQPNVFMGLNTTTPTATLDVRGVCGTGNVGTVVITNDNNFACIIGSPKGDLLVARSIPFGSSTPVVNFIVASSGKVGIGVANPVAQLDVQNGTAATIPFQTRNNTGTVLFSILNSGNTGIGTGAPAARLEIRNAVSTTNPLQVYNAANSTIVTIKDNGQMGIIQTTPTAMLDIKNNTINDDFRILDINNNSHFIVQNSGNAGIGVSNPVGTGSTLGIKAQGTSTTILDINATSATPNWNTQIRFLSNTGVVRHVITEDQGNLLIDPGFGGGANDLLKITGNTYTTGTADIDGRVKIGNVTVPNSNYMLYVEKGVLAERFKCALKSDNTNWSDYVFDKNYKLMSITDLEKYVNKNHHLPNIPSAKEVYRDGIDLGDMNAKLLEKIEELSLYVISLEKRVNRIAK